MEPQCGRPVMWSEPTQCSAGRLLQRRYRRGSGWQCRPARAVGAVHSGGIAGA
jgi:hypothetical protein